MFNKQNKKDLARFVIYKMNDAKATDDWEIMTQADFKRLVKGLPLMKNDNDTLESALSLLTDYIRWSTKKPRWTIEVLPAAARAYEQVALYMS